ncbi:uncharacterized protein BcabD6B2_41040 [Babesia caballi]|uniref:Uncharacterized protein n=1 Tax=Babesia caballi TaxID=5871 RepID=A0AAV4LY33_BABCB|nr:hypothetical protein, conserved [Babesia caballi]
MLPTALIAIIAAHEEQKTKLKLQGVGVIGKSTENTGAGRRNAKIELRITEEAVEPRFVGYGRRRALKPTKQRGRQESLAVEVRFQGAVGKSQIAPPAALIMTPPIDVGEGLVVEGEAAEEDLGVIAANLFVVRPRHFIGIIVIRVVSFRSKISDKGVGCALQGGEQGGGA